MSSELMPLLRVLELSGAGGVLVLGYIFLFRWLLPKVIKAVEDGMKSITEEIKRTNTTAKETNVALREIHRCLKEMTTKITDVVREEVQHAQDRQEDAIKDVQTAVTILSVESGKQSTQIDQLLNQLGS